MYTSSIQVERKLFFMFCFLFRRQEHYLTMMVLLVDSCSSFVRTLLFIYLLFLGFLLNFLFLFFFFLSFFLMVFRVCLFACLPFFSLSLRGHMCYFKGVFCFILLHFPISDDGSLLLPWSQDRNDA